MKISVVTVAYNSAPGIGQAIESFLRQTCENKELLIVDGRSTDDTVRIAESFRSPLIKLVSEQDSGIYDAMNKGLRLFGGDAVGFLNSDDMFHSDTSLDLISEALGAADIVFGDLRMVADHRTKRAVRIWQAGEFSSSAFRRGWVPPHATFYVRRGVVEEIGEFDLKYRIASDYDYMLRALMTGDRRVKYVPRILVDYRWGGMSSRSVANIVKGNLECLDSRRRHLRSPPVDAALFLRPLRRLLQLRSFNLRSGRGG